MSDPLLAYFQKMDDEKQIIVKESPKLDIDLYIQNYKGRTRFERLLLIGRSSVLLCVDALKAAVAEAKKGRDIGRYQQAVEHLRLAAPSDPDAVFDQAWIQQTDKTNKEETRRLENELKMYKNNLIKESIRMGNEELGKHLESTGDLRQALEAYQRMSPDLTTTKQFVEAGKLRSKVHLQMRDWINVGTSLNKLSDCFDDGEEDDKGFRPYYQIVTGLSLMETDKYAEAVQYFLNIDPAVPATHYADVASPNDIAIYGGLLALATMDRAALQKVLETSVHFRAFLVLEPHLRKAISHFVNGRYSACLQILESYRPDYLLDLYLQKHVAKIYNKIRHKCLLHYMKPFSRVDLRSIDAFGTPGSSIEADLVGMIRTGALQARINKIDNVVTMAPVNPRLQIQTNTLETVQRYEKDALDRLRRMSILAAELEVKGQRKQPVGGQSSEGDPVYADIMASS